MRARRDVAVATALLTAAACGGRAARGDADGEDPARLLFASISSSGLDGYDEWYDEPLFSPATPGKDCDALLSGLGVSRVGHLQRMLKDDVSVHAFISSKMTIDERRRPAPMKYGVGGDWMSVQAVEDEDGELWSALWSAGDEVAEEEEEQFGAGEGSRTRDLWSTVQKAFDKGFSIVLNTVEGRSRRLHALCERLASVFGTTVNANVYYTPAPPEGAALNQGFGTSFQVEAAAQRSTHGGRLLT